MSDLKRQTVKLDGDNYEIAGVPKRWINIRTEEQLVQLDELLRADTTEYVAFDTETTALGRRAQVFGFSVTVNGKKPDKPGYSFWYRFDEHNDEMNKYAQDIIRYIFSNEDDFGVIMANGKFDMVAVRSTFNIVFKRAKFNDTMLLHEVLRRLNDSKLKTAARRLLQEDSMWESLVKEWLQNHKITQKMQKDTGRSYYEEVDDAIMFPYAISDTEYCFRVFFKSLPLFAHERPELQNIYKLERAIAPICAEMEFFGQVLNTGFMGRLTDELDSACNLWLDEFTDLWAEFYPKTKEFAKGFSLNSPKVMKQCVYGTDKSKRQLGCKVVKRTEQGQPSLDAETLIILAEKHPILDKLRRYKKCAHALTIVQTLMHKSMNTESGRTIHTCYWQTLVTGRFSSRDPNLQNIMSDDKGEYKAILPSGNDISIRRGFGMPSGYILLKMDYAAFELRLIGNCCGDALFQGMILDGVDMHAWLAAKLYHTKLDALDAKSGGALSKEFAPGKCDIILSRKHKLTWKYYAVKSKSTDAFQYMRTVVKKCMFSIVYGRSGKSLSQEFKIPIHEAESLKTAIFGSFPVLTRWRKSVEAETARTRRMYTPYGRKRKLLPTDYVGTVAVNHVIQGGCADLLKFAMLGIAQVLHQKKSRMSGTIHDEIHVYLHHEELDLVDAIVNAMESVEMPRADMPLPMLAEVCASMKSWGDCVALNHDKPLTPQLKELWDAKHKPKESMVHNRTRTGRVNTTKYKRKSVNGRKRTKSMG